MKHPHAEIIKSWADGAQIQVKDGQNWYDIDEGNQIFSKHFEYRIKPAEPEREYPESKLSGYEMGKAYNDSNGMIGIANAALRHAIDHGQVVPRAEFDRAIGDRAARDMTVARTVLQSLLWVFQPTERVAKEFDEDYLLKMIERSNKEKQ